MVVLDLLPFLPAGMSFIFGVNNPPYAGVQIRAYRRLTTICVLWADWAWAGGSAAVGHLTLFRMIGLCAFFRRTGANIIGPGGELASRACGDHSAIDVIGVPFVIYWQRSLAEAAELR
jgi:hypothetical protein